MKKFGVFNTCFYLALLFQANEAARILGIFPAPLWSHFSYTNGVMKSLVGAGHEVTVITSFPESAARQNYTKIIPVPLMNKFNNEPIKYDEFALQNVFEVINLAITFEQELCNEVINSSEVQRMLKSTEKLYDVVFVEILHLYQCYLPIAEKMKTPVIGLVSYRTSAVADSVIHNPHNPVYVPYEAVTLKWNPKSLIGKMINVWNNMVVSWYISYVLPKEIEKFHFNHIDSLVNFGEYANMNLELIFYNNYAALLPRPLNPNAIDVAGVHVESAKPLPKDIQNFIDEADQGVILFSLGSVIRSTSLSIETQNAFKDAFAEIPQRVIWKFEQRIDNLSDNIMLLDWLPQRDILEHKNVIVFITHCGLGATIEAVHTATAVIACPLFGDQLDNAEILEDREVAVQLDIKNITKENILNALNKITNESKYSENMQKLSVAFKDRPKTPQQQVVYWTEHVIRNNGAKGLRISKSVASRLNWFQYLSLDDVLIVLIALTCVVYYLLGRISKYVYRRIPRKEKQKNKRE